MKIYRLKRDQPFSLDATLSCGQVFRWDKLDGGWWQGIVGNRRIRIRQDGATLEWEGVSRDFIEHYFSLDHNLNSITTSFDRDPFIHDAISRSNGLRLIRQPPWECLISYICATNSNIPMIRRRIRFLSARFGDLIDPNNPSDFAFPTPDSLAVCCRSALGECKMGYRAPYVQKTACLIGDAGDWERSIRELPFEDARSSLLKLPGVGPKAADCILLFGFQMFESFPVDVWIRRIMRDHYRTDLPEGTPLSSREYTSIRCFALEHFGPYCGYAQEYLYAAREG